MYFARVYSVGDKSADIYAWNVIKLEITQQISKIRWTTTLMEVGVDALCKLSHFMIVGVIFAKAMVREFTQYSCRRAERRSHRRMQNV